MIPRTRLQMPLRINFAQLDDSDAGSEADQATGRQHSLQIDFSKFIMSDSESEADQAAGQHSLRIEHSLRIDCLLDISEREADQQQLQQQLEDGDQHQQQLEGSEDEHGGSEDESDARAQLEEAQPESKFAGQPRRSFYNNYSLIFLSVHARFLTIRLCFLGGQADLCQAYNLGP